MIYYVLISFNSFLPQIFDRGLIVRQLRYAGLMETARIRRAGFPIRHSFFDFVNRYRFLVHNIPPPHKTDCRVAAGKICNEVLTGQTEFQLGNTKVFLKDSHDVYLEEMREKVLEKYILVLQRNIRRWIARRRFLQMKAAALVIQKHWRARGYRQRYLAMRRGYLRLQACIMSRQQTATHTRTRKAMIQGQALARGFMIRKVVREKGAYIKQQLTLLRKKRDEELEEMKKKGTPNYEQKANDNLDKRVNTLFQNVWVERIGENVTPTKKNAHVDDSYVDDMFDFLQDGSAENQVKGNVMVRLLNFTHAAYYINHPLLFVLFCHFSQMRQQSEHKQADIDMPGVEEPEEDLSAFDFRKFAATYFTGNSSYQHSRRALRRPLLECGDDGWAAARALWVALLRFMGDLPEPRDAGDADATPVMTKLTETLGRAFQNSEEYQVRNLKFNDFIIFIFILLRFKLLFKS